MIAGRGALRLFDAHCHLQDPRIYSTAQDLIQTATLNSGVKGFAVNGVSENDWHIVKQMAEAYPSIVPCFGLHPWHVNERSMDWLKYMREFLETTPSASIGEIGLDKGSRGRKVNFETQVQVFQQQLDLAKELGRPISVHCVHSYGSLLEIMQSTGPFPAGVILHSYVGSAELVPEFTRIGAYFSFSGYIMSMKSNKAKKILKSVPLERILLESDAPDALPQGRLDLLTWVPGDASVPNELLHSGGELDAIHSADKAATLKNASALPKEILNHPANIYIVLCYVSSMLEMSKEAVAEISYRNALSLFSYPNSNV